MVCFWVSVQNPKCTRWSLGMRPVSTLAATTDNNVRYCSDWMLSLLRSFSPVVHPLFPFSSTLEDIALSLCGGLNQGNISEGKRGAELILCKLCTIDKYVSYVWATIESVSTQHCGWPTCIRTTATVVSHVHLLHFSLCSLSSQTLLQLSIPFLFFPLSSPLPFPPHFSLSTIHIPFPFPPILLFLLSPLFSTPLLLSLPPFSHLFSLLPSTIYQRPSRTHRYHLQTSVPTSPSSTTQTWSWE